MQISPTEATVDISRTKVRKLQGNKGSHVTVAEQIAAETELNDRLASYAGRWVALRDHQIVADAATLKELHGQIEDSAEIEIVQVADDPHVACFY